MILVISSDPLYFALFIQFMYLPNNVTPQTDYIFHPVQGEILPKPDLMSVVPAKLQ